MLSSASRSWDVMQGELDHVQVHLSNKYDNNKSIAKTGCKFVHSKAQCEREELLKDTMSVHTKDPQMVRSMLKHKIDALGYHTSFCAIHFMPTSALDNEIDWEFFFLVGSFLRPLFLVGAVKKHTKSSY